MADSKIIFVVTHGDKHEGPNPGMTEKGFEEIRSIRYLVSPNPPAIVVGTGRRHKDVFNTLGFNSGPVRCTSAVGDPDSMDMIDGKKTIILADGTQLPPEQYTSLDDNAPAAKALIISLADGTVVCAGRPLMIMLGVNGKSAAVYRVFVQDGEITKIDHLVAYGEVDPALQK